MPCIHSLPVFLGLVLSIDRIIDLNLINPSLILLFQLIGIGIHSHN